MRPLIGDPAADAYLDALVARLGSFLGERMIGAWLVNSGARGDYVPGRSDIDLLVAVDGALREPAGSELGAALVHAALPCPAPRLELIVYRRSVLAAPGIQPAFELNLNTGPGIPDHVGTDPASEPSHWFVLDLAAARERSLAHAGPPLARLVAPIPDAVVLAALRDSQRWHAVNDTAAPNRVLNACRAWLWLAERHWSTKSEAAAWAVAAGGDGELIRLALARRRGDTDEALPAERVASFAAMVGERIEHADAGARVGVVEVP